MKEYFHDLKEIKQQKGYENHSNNLQWLKDIGAKLINENGATYRLGDWDIYATRNRCRNFKNGKHIQLSQLKKQLRSK